MNTTQPTSRSSVSSEHPLVVLKFGGTALGDADVLQRAAHLVVERSAAEQVAIVVSATGDVTDLLVQAVATVPGNPEAVTDWVEHVSARYQKLSQAVLRNSVRRRYDVFARIHLAALQRALGEVADEGPSPAIRDVILAAGERLMAPLVALLIEQKGVATTVVDAAALVRTDENYGNARVDRAVTYSQLRAWYDELPARLLPVITGFIGSTENGNTSTLGRGGTDYTAALVAAALHADRLERWTDVDGLYTRDPRQHAEAEILEYLSLDEAADLNRAGRLGMHVRSLDPLVEAGIPVHVRSIFTPEMPGTVLAPNCARLAS